MAGALRSKNISHLSNIIKLEYLYLTSNDISDISYFVNLTNLKWLSLSWNNISNVSYLSGLTKLESLSLGGADINNSDLTHLSGLTNLEDLVTKYIRSAEHVLQDIGKIPENIHLNNEEAKTVFDWANRYLKDAKYYKKKGKFETSLTSVAYCEGLLDALRLLGAVEFTWKR